MRAVEYPARGEVRLVERPDPSPGRGEVLLSVRASGLCHTDRDVLTGAYGTGAFPVVPGHEFAGEVVAAGEGTKIAPGTRVVVDPNLPCGACRACLRGWTHLCARLEAYGVTCDGGMAELCVVRADALHPIGDMPFARAALAEPMGCVLNGIAASNGAGARSAVIVGAGPMGVLMGLALRASGVADVTLCDLDAERLALASELGLAGIHPDGLDGMRDEIDLAVEATGRADVAARLPDLVAAGGTVHLYGVCPPEARLSIAPFDVFRRQLKIVGSHSTTRDLPGALALLERIGPAVDRLVTHRMDLDEMAATLAGHAPPGAMKVQLTLG